MSLYLEEFQVGQTFTSRSRTVTETDVVNFACSTGDMSHIHTDAAKMADSQFGQRIAHGMLGASWCHGFLNSLGIIEYSAIALLGIENWRFNSPIFFGDTLHLVITVLEVTPSKSKPDRGILKLQFDLTNQRGEICQGGVKTLMMKRLPQ